MVEDPRLPTREQCVLRYLVDAFAVDCPDDVFAVFADGTQWTYADMRREVVTTAAGLQNVGVCQDDNVLCWLPNTSATVRFWFAINYIGAVYVPINTAYRGAVLFHALANANARLMIAQGDLIKRLEGGAHGRVTHIGTLGPASVELDGVRLFPADDLRGMECRPLDRPIEPWDTQAILYTSGTTGPSKGVLSSYMQSYAMFGPETMPFLTAEDRYLINMPLFHVGGTGLVYSMLLRGGSIALFETFSVSKFWDQIRETGSTIVFLLGVMASFINQAPPRPGDRSHPLRKAFMVPLVNDVAGFVERFGVLTGRVGSCWDCSVSIRGMTEQH